jgi:SAM-dependent methyltransferase/methyltransferase-like protein
LASAPADTRPAAWTAYDEVPYPGYPYPQTHPDRLATSGRLFGMTPAPVERCRVLELGCGDGGNLIPMAYGLPESSFVGIDLASSAVAKGQARAGALGLDNVELVCRDLADYGPALGSFDFIVAHGVYSWVSDAVRDELLALCARALAPDGIAFVSYNALPGGHMRTMLREMMLFHARGTGTPRGQVERARGLLRVLAEAHAGSGGYRGMLTEQLERTERQSDAAILHDDLAAQSRPLYFHEFAAHAARHGFQYLAEADFFEMHAGTSSPSVIAALDELGDNVLAREQYLDFLKCRMYRQTLLCRADVRLERQLAPAVAAGFLVTSQARPADPGANLRDRSVVEFRDPRGTALRTDEPLIKLALERLASSWPRAVPFDELLHGARDAVSVADAPRAPRDATHVLGESILRGYAADVVQLHVYQPRFADVPGRYPCASALARLQAECGEPLTTLRHTSVRVDDDAGRRLVTLLDGTRDRHALVEAMFGQEEGESDLAAKLEAKVRDLARLALLEA